MSTVKSFLKETLARITGDKDTVVAEKNFRKCTAAIKGQLSALESQLVNVEDDLDTANERLNTVKYPTTLTSGGEDYIEQLVSAQESVEYQEDRLKDIKASIEFFKKTLEEYNTEVEA